MHGIIFIEFEKYVINDFGYSVWRTVLEKNELKDRVYESVNIYPDKEMFQLVESVAEAAGLEVGKLLEQFGIALVPDLMKVYRAYINPEWKTLDLLEHTESAMHKAVRQSTKGAAPPILYTRRTRANEVQIDYVSGRNMVEFGIGLIKGIAAYYGDSDRIQVDLQKNIEPGKSIITVRYY